MSVSLRGRGTLSLTSFIDTFIFRVLQESNASRAPKGGGGGYLYHCGGGVLIVPGATWYWQYWHRQPMGQPATFSAALETTFN